MASPFRLLFRIVYASIYTFLYILVVALLLVTPGDIINQSHDRGNIVPIIIVSVAYVSVILVIIVVFFLRLFINRAVLNSIPRAWIPIESGDLRKHVRKMIVAGLSRSAAIAFVSRPRIVPDELFDDMCPLLAPGSARMSAAVAQSGVPGEKHERATSNLQNENDNENEASNPPSISSPGTKAVRFKRVATAEKEKELGIDLPPCPAVWGEIEHPGWAPPNQPVPGLRRSGAGASADGSSEGPGASGLAAATLGAVLDGEDLTLQYSTVVAELPNLIEAKALTLAPPDPTSQSDAPQLDLEAVALLQRPIYMGLREYLTHLAELGVIDAAAGARDGDARRLGEVVASFVAAYEYARFSTQMLRHEQFRQLMHDLATILRRMTPLDPNLLLDGDGDGDHDDDGYSAYEKEGSFTYSEGDSRPYYSGYSGYSGHSRESLDTADSDDDIDDTVAPSSPATPTRSRSQRQHERDQERRGKEDVDESDSTSRRRRVARRNNSSHSSVLLPPRSRPRDLQPQPRPRPRPRPRSLRQVSSHSSSSGHRFAQLRNPYTVGSQPSSASLRSGLSAAPSVAASTLSARSASTASDGGSVIIRLADRHEQSQGLPYVLTMPL